MTLFHAISKRCVKSIALDLRRRAEEPVEEERRKEGNEGATIQQRS